MKLARINVDELPDYDRTVVILADEGAAEWRIRIWWIITVALVVAGFVFAFTSAPK